MHVEKYYGKFISKKKTLSQEESKHVIKIQMENIMMSKLSLLFCWWFCSSVILYFFFKLIFSPVNVKSIFVLKIKAFFTSNTVLHQSKQLGTGSHLGFSQKRPCGRGFVGRRKVLTSLAQSAPPSGGQRTEKYPGQKERERGREKGTLFVTKTVQNIHHLG